MIIMARGVLLHRT